MSRQLTAANYIMLFSGVLIQMVANSLKRVVHIEIIMSNSIKQQSYFSISIKLKRLKKTYANKDVKLPSTMALYTAHVMCLLSLKFSGAFLTVKHK